MAFNFRRLCYFPALLSVVIQLLHGVSGQPVVVEEPIYAPPPPLVVIEEPTSSPPPLDVVNEPIFSPPPPLDVVNEPISAPPPPLNLVEEPISAPPPPLVKQDGNDGIVPALFVFGDSLIDNGNNNNIPSFAKANYFPYGIDFNGGPTGRFCNGLTMVDGIALLLVVIQLLHGVCGQLVVVEEPTYAPPPPLVVIEEPTSSPPPPLDVVNEPIFAPPPPLDVEPISAPPPPLVKQDGNDGIVPALFVFGDSLIDNGNNNNIPSFAKANYFPYGIDFNGGPTGRFCNGLTMVDGIAQLLGLPLIPAYSEAIGDQVLRGVNYASAAAGILPDTGGNFNPKRPPKKGIQIAIRHTIATQHTRSES
ncbi:hypothetical protein DY000_02063644 [Brassica cretica]|uniref:Uncharacterized protein n=1 Tax=Brassica cretica TaxID=69181 RepID=A0ABQ7AY43_BRACR|nr:hypothetical protein DY000_02063644 [Brassica cretica]